MRCLAGYATPEQHALVRGADVERLPVGADALTLGPLRISTGRSGHMAGGVWCSVDDGRVRLVYCGDVVPASPVFAMDPIPRCDAIVIDASYGDDDATVRERALRDRRVDRCAPAGQRAADAALRPLRGAARSSSRARVALAPGMRDALRAQIDGTQLAGAGRGATRSPRDSRRAVDWQRRRRRCRAPRSSAMTAWA